MEQRNNYDYFVNGANIDFTYPLESEDVEVWFVEDTRCNLLIFQQYYNDVNAAEVVLSANGGVFPALRQSIVVWVEGYKQQEGPTGDYEIVGSTVEFKYTLEDEDVEVWFISGLVDVGHLGLFQDN